MIVALFAAAGVLAGLALDAAVAWFARETFERPEALDDDPDDPDAPAREPAPPRPLPRALTSRAWLRRILIVAATVALFAAAAARYEGHGGAPVLIALYLAALIGCAATDLISFRVPNWFTYPAILLALVVGLTAPGADRTSTLTGGLALGGGYFVLAVITRGGIGLGDVKLATFSGLALGLFFSLVALFITAIAGGVIAGALLLLRVRGRRDPMPYAPFIALATAWMLLTAGTSFLTL